MILLLDGLIGILKWENHCVTHDLYLPPIDEVRICTDDKGFTIGDYRYGVDVDFPIHLSEKLTHFDQLIYEGLVQDNVLPPKLLLKAQAHPNQGY